METNITYVVVGAVLFLLVALFLMLKYFTKKFGAEKVSSVLADVKEGIEKVDTTLDSFSSILPNGVSNIADTVLKWAHVAVNAVERMYLNGTINKEDRRDLAIEKTSKILNLIGIDVTPEVEEVIGTSLESAVNSLPKTHPVVAQKKAK